jgi:signal transduction histidine kinase
MALSYLFLRRQIMPRRDTVLQLASEIQILNQENLRRQQRARAEAFRQFSAFLRQMLLISLALGCGIAFLGAWRVLQLEGRVEKQLARTQEAEDALRQLSQELVHAQEEERRQLSRELHDEVGQILTGLRMELMSLAKYHDAPRPRFEARLQELRGALEQTVRAVRDLAMGLRPSMLDDLGLKPALEWQAREFSRRHGIPVTLQVEAPLESLPESHRTAIYRVVQEALTNCARHARAHSIEVDLRRIGDQLRVVVADDGVGMPSNGGRRSGLGLLGIEERAREIGGRAWVESRPGAGTAMNFEAPLTAENVHAEDAHPARG